MYFQYVKEPPKKGLKFYLLKNINLSILAEPNRQKIAKKSTQIYNNYLNKQQKKTKTLQFNFFYVSILF